MVAVLFFFYIIVTNFGYSITFNNKNDIIENKINNIQSEIISMNSKINNTTPEKDNFKNYSLPKLAKNQLINYKQKTKQQPSDIISDDDDDDDDDVDVVVNKNQNSAPQNNQKRTVVVDPIANYDTAKILDPLVDPLQRTSADQIPTPSVAMQLNFPSQGILDKYHRIGLLIAIESDSSDNHSHNSSNNIVKRKGPQVPVVSNENEKNYNGVQIAEKGKGVAEGFGNMNSYDDNNILELMGKKRYHQIYRYFTSITMGNKIIKVMVKSKNGREFYCGDIVFIKELNKSYRVEIDDMDMIEYNPYMI